MPVGSGTGMIGSCPFFMLDEKAVGRCGGGLQSADSISLGWASQRAVSVLSLQEEAAWRRQDKCS